MPDYTITVPHQTSDGNSVNVTFDVPKDKLRLDKDGAVIGGDKDYIKQAAKMSFESRYPNEANIHPPDPPAPPPINTYKGMRIVPPVESEGAGSRFLTGLKSGVNGLLSVMPGHAGSQLNVPHPESETLSGLYKGASFDPFGKNDTHAITDLPIISDIDRLLRGDIAGEIGNILPTAGAGTLALSPKARAVVPGFVKGATETNVPFNRWGPASMVGGLIDVAHGGTGFRGLLEGGVVDQGIERVVGGIKGAYNAAKDVPLIDSNITNLFKKPPIDAIPVDDWRVPPDTRTGLPARIPQPTAGSDFSHFPSAEPSIQMPPRELPPGTGQRLFNVPGPTTDINPQMPLGLPAPGGPPARSMGGIVMPGSENVSRTRMPSPVEEPFVVKSNHPEFKSEPVVESKVKPKETVNESPKKTQETKPADTKSEVKPTETGKPEEAKTADAQDVEKKEGKYGLRKDDRSTLDKLKDVHREIGRDDASKEIAKSSYRAKKDVERAATEKGESIDKTKQRAEAHVEYKAANSVIKERRLAKEAEAAAKNKKPDTSPEEMFKKVGEKKINSPEEIKQMKKELSKLEDITNPSDAQRSRLDELSMKLRGKKYFAVD